MEDSNKKWYLFGGLAIVVVGLVVFLLLSVFRPSGPAPTASGSVPVVIPDGDVASLEDSKSKVYRGSTESYFEQLAAAGDEEISLVSDSLHTSRPSVPVSGAPAPSGGASSVERVFGSPAPSAEGPVARATGGGSAPRPMSADEKLEYDRKRAEMVRDVLTGGTEETVRTAQGDSHSEAQAEESLAPCLRHEAGLPKKGSLAEPPQKIRCAYFPGAPGGSWHAKGVTEGLSNYSLQLCKSRKTALQIRKKPF